MDNYLQVVQKYAVFSGRASRREYWMFFLFNILIAIGLAIIFGIMKAAIHVNLSFLSGIYSLALLCPGIAVAIRRLHDTNRSGLWLLVSLVPLIGSIVLIVFLCQKPVDAGNQFSQG
jgi:uncharacterized membrane protein YhaH (DUF805 family)